MDKALEDRLSKTTAPTEWESLLNPMKPSLYKESVRLLFLAAIIILAVLGVVEWIERASVMK